ncbi:Hint domain-containing protein [Algirhabdus cladophorae]|uniref:Hint domain-containing protein n=1 Tax=Algirhabdus cladophorae TaxID=3377108 RepID=UPI003B849CA0
MAISTQDVIYLGTFADADTDETTASVENAGIYLQTFGSPSDPLINHVEEMTFEDADDSGDIGTDNTNTSDTTSGEGGLSQVDSLAVVNLTVTYSDGSTMDVTNAVMFQTTNGELFLSNSSYSGNDLRGPDTKEIQSVQVTEVTNTNYTGLWHNMFQDFACFAKGTKILTPDGCVAIETLKAGDLVETQDRGAQPIRWIGAGVVPTDAALAPIRITAGALGLNVPNKDLSVSPQHRMLVRSAIIQRMTDAAEALVAAKALLPLAGVYVDRSAATVRYYHMLFDHHEVIWANGAASESLLPGKMALSALGPQAMLEILSIFPQLAPGTVQPHPARTILEGKRRKKSIERHLKNDHNIWSDQRV